MIDCPHWSECPRKGGGGGCCSLYPNLNPSFSYCETCQDRPKKDTGLGDTVARIIKVVTLGKIKPKSGCGCSKRRKILNKLFPYKDRAV